MDFQRRIRAIWLTQVPTPGTNACHTWESASLLLRRAKSWKTAWGALLQKGFLPQQCVNCGESLLFTEKAETYAFAIHRYSTDQVITDAISSDSCLVFILIL